MFKLIKKIFFAFFLLYSFNLIAVNFNIILPINLVTVGILTFFDIPGMIMLLLAMFTVFN